MIRYLLDENLPISLVQIIGGESSHAGALPARATDDELWSHARRHNLVLLTKDADFFDRMLLQGPPPKVVWFRVGNLRKTEVEQLASRVWPQVLLLLETHDLVEIHRHKLEGLRRGED